MAIARMCSLVKWRELLKTSSLACLVTTSNAHTTCAHHHAQDRDMQLGNPNIDTGIKVAEVHCSAICSQSCHLTAGEY
jgi:hypothetical protein